MPNMTNAVNLLPFIAGKMFLVSSAVLSTYSFFNRSVQLTFSLRLLQHISELPRYFLLVF